MKMPTILIFGSTLALAACGQQASPAPEPKSEAAPAEASAVTDTQPAPATATGEPGSGTYAADCAAKTGAYAIQLSTGSDGMTSASVTSDGKAMTGLLTAYSYMGKTSPADFLVAIIFDKGNAPVPAADDPRIEIWKGEASYYALVNGDKKLRLSLCS